MLKKINNYRQDPIEENLIEQILAIVMMNPLLEDRASCQDQLKYLIEQHVKK